MSDRLNTTAKKSQNLDSTFKVSPFQSRGFAVQQKSVESSPDSKVELWENYQQAKQLNQKGTNISPASILPIQAKLTIGQPGDKYEQEADSVADRVMAMSEPAQVQREELGEEEEELQMKPLAGTISPLVQREELPEEEEELQMKSLDNSIQREALPEEEEEIQMKEAATSSTPAATTSLEDRLSSSKGGGSPLSDDVRSFMEPRFGSDFSGVRVHTGSDAVQMNQDVSAQAFAHGSDVYFGAGKAPGKDALTAHELTHVVQQTGTGYNITSQTKLKNQLQGKSTSHNPQILNNVHPSNPNVDRMKLEGDFEKMATASSTSLALQRAPSQKSTEDRLSDLEKQQKMLAAKQQAISLDVKWHGELNQLLSSYRESTYLISRSFQKATASFQSTQTEQMQMDAMWTQVILMAVTVGFSAIFEPGMGALGKMLNKTEDGLTRWTKIIEKIENPANASVSGGSNVAATQLGINDTKNRQIPDMDGGGGSNVDPLSYLTQNLEKIEKHTRSVENKFIARAITAEKMTAEDWGEWNPTEQEASYKYFIENLKIIGPDIAELKSYEDIALIIERHLWAGWIGHFIPIILTASANKPKKARTEKDYATIVMSLGSAVEDELNKIGISGLASVKLTGHWYSSNSDDYEKKLYVWAGNYSEKMSSE
jgi:hypothetical protein